MTIHATSIWNEERKSQGHCDIALSPAGLQMAQLMAKRQDLRRIQAVYTSDLKRSYQTAMPLSEQLNLQITKRPELREGNWAHYHRDESSPPLPFSGGFETSEDLRARAQTAMDRLASEVTCSPVLVITHGAFLREFLGIHLKEDLEQYRGIRTAMNRLSFYNGEWSVISLNDDSHLDALLREESRQDCG